MITLKLKRVRANSDLPLPNYQSSLSSGMDLRADVVNDVVLKKGSRQLIPIGISVEIPAGYEGQIRPRSGLALKHGVSLVNAPGTVDADYRGEICVIVINLGDGDFVIRRGDRIAQLVIAPVVQVQVVEAGDLSPTVRNVGGFGSTGSQ